MKTNVNRSLTETEITTVRKSRRSFLFKVVGVGALTSAAALSTGCEELRCDADTADVGLFQDPYDSGDPCR